MSIILGKEKFKCLGGYKLTMWLEDTKTGEEKEATFEEINAALKKKFGSVDEPRETA